MWHKVDMCGRTLSFRSLVRPSVTLNFRAVAGRHREHNHHLNYLHIVFAWIAATFAETTMVRPAICLIMNGLSIGPLLLVRHVQAERIIDMRWWL